MTKNPLVSIVVPAYNVENHIEKCLRSLTSQNHQNLEILVIDDGSTDRTHEITKSIAATDTRIQVSRQPNAGAAHARNSGIDQARGEFISFVDSDDSADENLIQRLLLKSLQQEADLAICTASIFDERTGARVPAPWHEACVLPRDFDSRSFNYQDIKPWLFHLEPASWCKLYRSAFLKGNGIRFPEGSYPEDTAFFFNAVTAADRIVLVREILYRHAVARKGSVMTELTPGQLDYFKSVKQVELALKKNGARDFLFDEFTIWKYGVLISTGRRIESSHQKIHFEKLKAEAVLDQKEIHSVLGMEHWLSQLIDQLLNTPFESLQWNTILMLWQEPKYY